MQPVSMVCFQYHIPFLPGAVHGKVVDQDFRFIFGKHLEGSAWKNVFRIVHAVF